MNNIKGCKIKIFNDTSRNVEQEYNEWIDKYPNIQIYHVAYAATTGCSKLAVWYMEQ